jgi:hypothetical protein
MMSAAARLTALLAICGVAAFAAPAARAFTMDSVSNTNPDGSQKYVDPDNQFSDSDKSKNTIKQGNTTIHFGGSPGFSRQYNSNQMFDPASRLENER